MFIKYDLIILLISTSFLIIKSESKLSNYELFYQSSEESGWSITNNADDTAEIIFNCPQGFEKKHASILWQMNGIPHHQTVKSVRIQNCNLKLTVVPKYRNAELERLIIKNITELDIETSYVYPLVRMKYDLSVLILEDIKNIENFNTKSITGSFQQVSIRNCKIGQLHWNSIMISESKIFEFTNNKVEQAKSSFNLENVKQIIFVGNEFYKLGDNFIMFVRHSYEYLDLQFEDNVIHESDYSTMEFGLNNLESTSGISVKRNRFNCLKSKWLHLVESDNKKMISADTKKSSHENFEEQFLMNDEEDNICFDTPCPVSLSKFRRLYKFYGKNEESYCNELEPTAKIDSEEITSGSYSTKNFGIYNFTFVFTLIFLLLLLLSDP